MRRPRHTLAAMAAGAIALGSLSSPSVARDPGDTPTRAGSGNRSSSSSPPRGGSADGIVPERVNRDELYPPRRVDPPEPPLYQRVESEADRGRGRIEDENTIRSRRREQDADFPPGRYPQADLTCERQRFQEDFDRQRRLDRRAVQSDEIKSLEETAARDAATEAARRRSRSEPSAQPMGSVLTRHVAEESKRLESARQKYQADLNAAETERDAAVRAAPTREAKAEATRRFDQRRLELTRSYQQYRKKVLGTDEAQLR